MITGMMKPAKILGRWVALAGLGLAMTTAASAEQAERIVSLGGSVTEILYALGQQDRIAAVDVTSVYPPNALSDKPNVGYIRALNAEGVLSANPDLILSEHDAGPPEVVDILKSASVPFVQLDAGYSAEGILDKITRVGEAVGQSEAAAALAEEVGARLARVKAAVDALPEDSAKQVLFILSYQDGRLMVAGEKSHADAVIRMAGGVNLMQGMEGYKQVDDEALMANPPDAIVMMARREHGVTNEQLADHPALKASPAIQKGRIIRMDGMYLLGFGPRTASAVADLARFLYPHEPALEALPASDDPS